MLKLIGFLVLWSGLALGQDAMSAQKAARELAGAVKSGDLMWMVDKLYPQVRKTTAKQLRGGDAELVAKYRQMNSALKKSGVVFETFEVSDPFGQYLVKNKTELIVILPTRLVMAVREGGRLLRTEKRGFLYAISRIPGADWHFIDGSTYSINEMRNYFYDLPKNIPLPPIEMMHIQR